MKDFFRKHKGKLIAAAVIIAALAVAFYIGGGSPDSHGWNPGDGEQSAAVSAAPEDRPTAAPKPSAADAGPSDSPAAGTAGPSAPTPSPASQPAAPSSTPAPTPTPEPMPVPTPTPTPASEPEPEELTCTISISCATILNNMDYLAPGKAGLVPSGGYLLGTTTVTFSQGESVFDVLKRVTRANNIHMEASFTPMYNSVYIEGIGNLYEFDCGELSGWMYSVNGVFPNYGCSAYTLSDGDVIRWVYTCDLGADVGGSGAVQG